MFAFIAAFCLWLAWFGAAVSRPAGAPEPGVIYTTWWVVWLLFGLASLATAIATALAA